MGHIYPDILINNIAVATAISEFVKASFGPRGMNKMIIDGDEATTVTSDGATILRKINAQHPVAKVMCEIASAVDSEVGDGTIAAVILAGALLEEAENLVKMGVHPTVIIGGYKRAMDEAIKTLTKIAVPLSVENKNALGKVVLTTINGKIGANVEKEYSSIIVQAINKISQKTGEKIELNNVKIDKIAGGSLRDTALIDGIMVKGQAVHPSMPTIVEDAKILLIMCPMEVLSMVQYSKWFAYPTGKVGINISDPKRVKQFLEEENRILTNMIKKIESSGANVVFCFRGMDDSVSSQLAVRGILAFKRTTREDIEKLAKATGGKFISSWSEVKSSAMGRARLVHTETIGDEDFTFVEGCSDPKALSIVIRGGTKTLVEDVERVIHKGLCSAKEVMEDRRIVAGGGSIEMDLAYSLEKCAKRQEGRVKLAIQAFSKGLESIPKTLAQNVGLDPIEVITEIRMQHAEGRIALGIDAFNREVRDVMAKGIFEPLGVKIQVIKSATEAANVVLRVDTIITASEGEETKVDETCRREVDEDQV